MKNPFKIGDLVKLRPDVLGRHSTSIPAHAGFTTAEFQWRDTLRNLADKPGKITRVSPDNKHVNVEYEQSWTTKDAYNKSYIVNSIGIDFTELVPFEGSPVEEGILGTIHPTSNIGVDIRQLVAKYNAGQVDKNTLTKKMEELMWQSRTKNPNAWPWLKSTVDRLKNPPANIGVKLKFEEGVGYVYDKDMKKDPKHIKGKRWTVKFESEGDLDENGPTSKSPVTESEIRNVIQELLKELQNKKKVTESRETADKNYIIFGKSGPVTTYYVNSPSQGEKMIQFGRDMAYRFQTLEQVRNKIIDLKNKYKGITNWDFEIVQNLSPSNVTATQSIVRSPNRKGHTVSKPVYKRDWEEWFVRYAIDGKTDEGKSYHTDDKEDALSTYIHMLKYAEEQNKKS